MFIEIFNLFIKLNIVLFVAKKKFKNKNRDRDLTCHSIKKIDFYI
jgi:hypothetical protein